MQTPIGSQDLHEEALGLDLRQMEGLERALSLPPYGFLAVEGPPGTGKTSIIAAVACEIAMAGGKVLTTSLTNAATLTSADVAETRQPPTACRSTPHLELIEELVYSVVCMRRDFSRIRRQIGKRRESQMSLIGGETGRINAACALGLCVAGLRGQLRKLPFGVSACYAGLGRAPMVRLGWVACSGDVLPDLSSEFEDPLYGAISCRAVYTPTMTGLHTRRDASHNLRRHSYTASSSYHSPNPRRRGQCGR